MLLSELREYIRGLCMYEINWQSSKISAVSEILIYKGICFKNKKINRFLMSEMT